jgi:hypothetical protein
MRLRKLLVTVGLAGVFAAAAVTPTTAAIAPASTGNGCIPIPVYDERSGVFYEVEYCF